MTASVVGISGSPGSASRSRTLLELALASLERQGAGTGRLIDLARLPADALLGRREDRDVAEALQATRDAAILVLAGQQPHLPVEGEAVRLPARLAVDTELTVADPMNSAIGDVAE